ncbi:MAG: site-2 protease family protein [Ruminococcus sp.]|nr:site-2 protease family protein [Ruminococcus sp.]MDE7225711.1 site-2 protease family protein [Ruminococcus sp.]
MATFFSFFSRALMLLLVLPLTNSAKGLVARWLGDDTADREGRITLNPMAHLDILGSLAILLCGFGWSKPMPINVNRMRNYRQGVILISLTGPVVHFLSAIVCYNIASILSYVVSGTAGGSLFLLFYMLAGINVCLGTINILPIPPMDGFNVLHQFTGEKFNRWFYSNYRMIMQASQIILLVLFFMGRFTMGLLDPLGWIINAVSSLLQLTASWVPHVFG